MERFLFLTARSSLVFRENTEELYSRLATQSSEDLQPELTAHGLVPSPLAGPKSLPVQASISPFDKSADPLSITDCAAPCGANVAQAPGDEASPWRAYPGP